MVLLRSRDWAGGVGPVVDAWKGVLERAVVPGAGAVAVVAGCGVEEAVVPRPEN